jgi:H+/Cl- antiporter ClcA
VDRCDRRVVFAYIEIDAVADFFPPKIGSLPFSSIWFGAVGGLLVSLEGIFKHNHSWLRSYDYWHYLRPLLGAIMGTLGCLIFVVLTSAAASSQPPTPDPAFYAVIALSLGYREKHFRELLMRLVDTIIVPNQTEKSGATAEANRPPERG